MHKIILPHAGDATLVGILRNVYRKNGDVLLFNTNLIFTDWEIAGILLVNTNLILSIG